MHSYWFLLKFEILVGYSFCAEAGITSIWNEVQAVAISGCSASERIGVQGTVMMEIDQNIELKLERAVATLRSQHGLEVDGALGNNQAFSYSRQGQSTWPLE